MRQERWVQDWTTYIFGRRRVLGLVCERDNKKLRDMWFYIMDLRDGAIVMSLLFA